MSEELRAILNDDGVFEEYDDTYDLTIHCENEEEQEEVLNRLNWRWIPVSERLPEKNVEVLATTESGYITIAEWFEYDHWFIHEGSSNAHTDELTAWMPLPEPYEAESEEEEE